MTCQNVENDVVVVFEKVDNVFMGKLRDIPMDLFGNIAELEYWEKVIADIVKNAKNVFLRQLENGIIRYHETAYMRVNLLEIISPRRAMLTKLLVENVLFSLNSLQKTRV